MYTAKFSNADDLVAFCKKNQIFYGQVIVDHNPFGEGKEQVLNFSINLEDKINTYINGQDSLPCDCCNVRYSFNKKWHRLYDGNFKLILAEPLENYKTFSSNKERKLLKKLKELLKAIDD